jgi:hypothetical protein
VEKYSGWNNPVLRILQRTSGIETSEADPDNR